MIDPSLRRKKPLSRFPKRKPEVRIGKVTGKIRVSGKALERLREACFDRDNGRCQTCGDFVYYSERWDGDTLAFDMAHIESRGASGSDELSNVKTMCHRCHMKEHTEGKG